MEFNREKYVRQLSDRRQNGLIKVITGSRRSGKSYILNELYYRSLLSAGIRSTHIIRFAFDTDDDIDLLDGFYPDEPTKIRVGRNGYIVNSRKFRSYIKEKTKEEGDFYLLLDEVQLLEDFVGTLNGFLRNRKYDVYVTGSNSRFLSSDIATEFRGRGSVIHVLPLAFSEYIQGTDMPIPKAWDEYITTGGIPLVALLGSQEEKMSYLETLCEETYLKDIVQHNGIRKTAELGETFNVIASMIGTPVNVRRITNTFRSVAGVGLTEDTVASFIGFFQDAFLVSKADRFNIKGREYISSPFKLYFEDIGVRNARLGFRQIEEPHIMENVIYNELRYRGFNVDVGEVRISEKTDDLDANGKNIFRQKSVEVDFVATLGSLKYYIQSALSLYDDSKRFAEKRGLYSIEDAFRKIVITKNGLGPQRDEKGVLTLDLFDFLLNADSLDH
ncbi:MAG: ATP-binding protein [Spirochaetales bacterium]|nr:ATP-binding protein [Spirochaetales bacterium]